MLGASSIPPIERETASLSGLTIPPNTRAKWVPPLQLSGQEAVQGLSWGGGSTPHKYEFIPNTVLDTSCHGILQWPLSSRSLHLMLDHAACTSLPWALGLCWSLLLPCATPVTRGSLWGLGAGCPTAQETGDTDQPVYDGSVPSQHAEAEADK